jgi:DivIVA domain-containing protein
VTATERRRMREQVREVDFPAALRGYDRPAVDRYVQQVNRLIAELEISSSPESAIRHALEEVSEETSSLLQRAYDTADEITARSRAKADDRLQQADREAEEVRETAEHQAREALERAQSESEELHATATREAHELRERASREAHELRETAAREAERVRATAQREAEEVRGAAETRFRELERDARAIWRERRRLIEDMSAVAQQQLEISEAAATRFPRADAIDEASAPSDETSAEEEPGASQAAAALPDAEQP